MGVGPGDRVLMQFEDRAPVEVPVDGIYKALYAQPRQGFWRAWSRYIYPSCPSESSCPTPAQFVLADLTQAVELTRGLGVRSATFGWEAPLAAGQELTLEQTRELQTFNQGFLRDVSSRRGEYYEVFRCCGRQWYPVHAYASFTSEINRVVSQVDKRMTTIEGPVQLLLAAAVVAGAGAFAMATRRVESTYLFARGRSPLTMGAKASLEALIPSVLGSAAGLGLAFLLVKTVGPAGPVGEALRTAGIVAALAAPAAALLVGGVSAVSFLRQSEHHRARLGVLARLPWELVLIGVSVWLLRRLWAGGAFIEVPGLEVDRPSAALLLFPVLFMAGTAVLTARAFRLGLGWLRSRTGRLSPAGYLAANRLAAGPKPAVLLFAACALCLGVFVHSQTMVGSLQTTVDGKAKLFVGSDVQTQIDADYPIPPDFPLPVTKVTRIRSAGKFGGTDRQFDLFAVDPATLPSVGFWRNEFADRPLEELVDLLRSGSADELSIIVSGGEQQRAAFAQALVGGAEIVVADEPTAELDSSSGRSLIDKVHGLVDAGISVVVATHDPQVQRTAEAVIHLDHGVVRRPASPSGGSRVPRPTATPAPWAPAAGDPARRWMPPSERTGVPGAAAAAAARTVTESEADGPPLLRIERVSKSFQRGDEIVHAVEEVSLSVGEAEVVGLVGRSGSGKTTLLSLVAGWERPDSGTIDWADGRPLAGVLPWREVSVLPQKFGLIDELSVRQNIEYPARLAGTIDESEELLEELLDSLGLSALQGRYPKETSIGEQQRTALARALVLSPRLLLADEPSGHQDRSFHERVFATLRRAAIRGTTCLVATHNEEAAPHLDRVVHISDGRLQEPAST
jgi:putative ABC transport system ATP-binding protein